MIEVRRYYGVIASMAEKTDLLVTLSFPRPGPPCFLFVETPFSIHALLYSTNDRLLFRKSYSHCCASSTPLVPVERLLGGAKMQKAKTGEFFVRLSQIATVLEKRKTRLVRGAGCGVTFSAYHLGVQKYYK
jgi:hypothetical protein